MKNMTPTRQQKKTASSKGKLTLKEMEKSVNRLRAESIIKAEVTCQMICGDGSGNKPEKHFLPCIYASAMISDAIFELIVKERDKLWEKIDHQGMKGEVSTEYNNGYVDGMNFLLDALKKYL